MPIMRVGRNLLISHPISRFNPDSARLGDMSWELALWLNQKLTEHEYIELGDESDIEMMSRYFQRSDIHRWNVRCYLAATRGYKPTLCAENWRLTRTGLELAKIAKSVASDTMAEMNNTDEEELKGKNIVDSTTWTNADDIFVSATIPIRAAAMVKMLDLAILDAEANNRTEIPEDWNKDLEPPQGTIKETITESNAEILARRIIDETSDIMRVVEEHNQPQPLIARTYQTGPERQGFVPTSILEQKSRNDLKVLVKLGLVDLKAVAAGVRGRPKHIVRVNDVGRLFVIDLTRRNLI